MSEVNIQELREKAEGYYDRGEFFCSEAIIKVIKDAFAPEISDDVVKMASGFPVGMGRAGCTCGALSGGVMALGMIFGRNTPNGTEVAKTMEISKELHDKFREMNKSACCRVLTRGMELGSPVHKKQCVRLTGEVAEEVAKIIIRESK